MSRWERFWMRRCPISYFSEETGGAALRNRRATDTVADEMVKEIAHNGQSVEELVARNYLENKVDHKEIFTKISFCSKFVWICIGILVSAFAGGIIALICNAASAAIGG